MRQPTYRAVVALLDLAVEDVEHRCASWRALDALRLTDEDIAEVARRLDVDDTGDDRRARMWTAWSASIRLARQLTEDASNESARGPLCGVPPSGGARTPRGLLRVVRGSTGGEKT